jgi:uncharacterized membrane protein YbhN (UPF0104 family)
MTDGGGSREAGRRPRHRVLIAASLAAVTVVLVYAGLPAIAGLDETWERIRGGSPGWLVLAVVLELASYAGYVVLLRAVPVRDEPRFGWRESIEVTLAGVAATRLLAAAGAGGVALTAWALRGAGMSRGKVIVRLTSFLVVLYGVFMAALVIGGSALALGFGADGVGTGLSIVPAAFGLCVIVAALTLSRLRRPTAPVNRDAGRLAWARGRGARLSGLLAAGVRDALSVARRREPGLLGALAWWAFDIATLGACFHAFGEPPPVAVLVTGYFVGMLANVLPLPGGIGGVDLGMVGAFAAYGVDAGLAVVAVLAYRMFSFWLPTVPGAIAYVRLRRDVDRWRLRNPRPATPFPSS